MQSRASASAIASPRRVRGTACLSAGSARLLDEMVVVLDEPFPAFLVGQLTQLGQSLEIVLAGCAGGEQDQDRRGLVGLVAEPVDAARRHIEEVIDVSVHPLGAVV